MKRRVWLILPVVAVGVAAAWGGWRYAGLGGPTAVEDWVRQYLVTVLQRHLNPQVHLGEFDYQYPRTVSITDFRLRQDNIDILSVNQIRLELAEIPRTGEPIHIERIDLAGPAFRLEKTQNGELAGWSDLLRPDAEQGEENIEPGYRVSDFMRLKLASIRNGAFTYRANADQAETVLSGIHAELETPAADEGAGWYQLIGKLTRDELFGMSLNGRINVDTGDIVVNGLDIQGSLDETRYSIFPESVQALLRQYQLRGSLALDASGVWSPRDADKREVHAKGRLGNTHFVYDGAVMSSTSIDIQADLAGNTIQAVASGDALNGNATLRFEDLLEDARPGELTVNVLQIDLSQLVHLAPPNLQRTLDPLHLQGRMSGDLKTQLSPNFTLESGNATVTVEPAALQLLRRNMNSPKVTVTAQVEGRQAQIEVVAGELQDDTQKSARDVRVTIKTDSGRTDVFAAFVAFGGRADGSIQFNANSPGEYPFAIRASGVRFEELRSLAPDADRQVLKGSVSGNLEGTWNSSDWTASTLAGMLSTPDARLQLASASLPISTGKVAVRLNDRRIELSGRVNAAGGNFTGRIGWNVPSIETIDVTGDIDSISLAAALDVSGQSWNRPPGGAVQFDTRLSGDLSLAIPTVQPTAATGRVDLRAGAGHFHLGKTRFPMDACTVVAEIRDQRITGRTSLTFLGGRAELDGSAPLDPRNDWAINWHIRDIQLERLFALKANASRQQYRGRLSSDGDVKGRITSNGSSFNGRGRLNVTQGQLLELPVIREIASLLRPAGTLIGTATDDTANAEFDIQPDGLVSESFEVKSPLMALRGRGRVQFDGRLDLVVRATAAPKITKLLGPLDRLIDDASGRLVTYRVGGTTEHPSVRVEPLGLSVFPEDR